MVTIANRDTFFFLHFLKLFYVELEPPSNFALDKKKIRVRRLPTLVTTINIPLEQLDNSGLPAAWLAHQRHLLTGLHSYVQLAKHLYIRPEKCCRFDILWCHWCSGDFEILHEIVRDTKRINLCFSDFRIVSRTISCSFSEESPLHLTH